MDKRIIVDGFDARTDLCTIGEKFNTDKSPYAPNSVCGLSRKGYTIFYSMIFEPLRYNKLNICEIGIEAGSSLLTWEEYFPYANIYGFEYYDEKIEKCRRLVKRTPILKTDVSSVEEIENTYKQAGQTFDIIIDDSTHSAEHQKNIIRASINYLKSGGILIIEDMWIHEPDDILDEVIADNFSLSLIIVCDHNNENHGGNNKIWYGVKK